MKLLAIFTTLGYQTGFQFTGYVKEIRLYDGNLPEGARLQIVEKLKSDYGIA